MHWNNNPLYLSEEDRYRALPWLYEAAEFRRHAGERVLEIGCGSGCDLLQFAKHGAIATGVDIAERHLDLARGRVGGLAAVQYASACHLRLPTTPSITSIPTAFSITLTLPNWLFKKG